MSSPFAPPACRHVRLHSFAAGWSENARHCPRHNVLHPVWHDEEDTLQGAHRFSRGDASRMRPQKQMGFGILAPRRINNGAMKLHARSISEEWSL